MKILIIVTSTGTFANGKLATGLWLSEFTHIYHSAKESGYDITVANPKGGYTPIDPESLKPIFLDEKLDGYIIMVPKGDLNSCDTFEINSFLIISDSPID